MIVESHPKTPPIAPLSATQALPFFERLAIFRRECHRLSAPDLDLQSGERRLTKLKGMPPFDQHPQLWTRFLEAIDIAEDDLLRLFALPGEFLMPRSEASSRWVDDFEEALTAFPWENPPEFSWPSSMGPLAKLLNFSRPIIAWAMNRIERGLAAIEVECNRRLMGPNSIQDLFLSLAGTAYFISYRTLVLELNICRLRGELVGKTPAERFEYFAALLLNREHVKTLHEEYPVLIKEIVEGLKAIADFGILFLQHLAMDRTTLEAKFFAGESLPDLAKISMGGDSHRGGRRVLVLQFEGGCKLLYKPHSLRIDEHFQGLLEFLNKVGQQPPFRTMLCLDRGDHGWTEFIEEAECSTDEELKRFYLRQGSLLALLYGILATDFHHENLIASGEHPFLVDLESLFHPTLQRAEENRLDQAVRDAMGVSVLRTALLPSLRFVGNSETPIDVGGLSDVEGQQSPLALPFVNMLVEDEARIERTMMKMRGSQNIPKLLGTKADPSEHTETIVSGFTAMYKLLIAHRRFLLAPSGPIRRFAGDEIRFIFRHTRTYALLSRETLHPDLQRDALERDFHLFRLWFSLEDRQDIAGLIESEIKALWQGDVPYFYTRTDALDLFDHEDRRVTGLLATPCLDEVCHHIQELNEDDLTRQVWFIRGAMACQRIQGGHEGKGSMGDSFWPISEGERPPVRDRYLEEACRVGDRLSKLALRGESDEEATWLGMVLLRDNFWQLLPLGIDLYNGLAGIVIFLAYLARLSGKVRYSDLARSALSVARRHEARMAEKILLTGAYTGWGGLIYLYTHLYHLWREPVLLEDAFRCARSLQVRISGDESHEVMHGNAGAVLALHSLYEVHPVPEVLDLMEQCGRHILSHAKPMAEGIGWFCKSLNCPPLAGFSHGASGVASALEALYRRSGREEFLRGAKDALAYENTLFSEERSNWLDLRGHRLNSREGDPPPSQNFPVAWCNGAPGIGLSRFRMSSLDGPALRADIEAAVTVTRTLGFGYTHSLCHGDLGNLELFLAAREFGWPCLEAKEIEFFASGIVEGIRQKGWVCGTPRGVETPGLMTGIAGIGYGFLRLFEPDATPSVLLLDPPRL